jgi:predicted Zn-dependent protease
MHVELLFWDGCPSHPRALADLRAAMADFGLDPSTVAIHEIDTHEQATHERFVGSPTIRIDGVDVQPTDDEPYGLACRVYHRRDGRISPTPDPADVREALRAALAHATTFQTDPAERR